jgi:hypothetical protein
MGALTPNVAWPFMPYSRSHQNCDTHPKNSYMVKKTPYEIAEFLMNSLLPSAHLANACHIGNSQSFAYCASTHSKGPVLWLA